VGKESGSSREHCETQAPHFPGWYRANPSSGTGTLGESPGREEVNWGTVGTVGYKSAINPML